MTRPAPAHAGIALAALLLVLSLGLPWGFATRQNSIFHPPRHAPAPVLCHSEWDTAGNVQLICTPDFSLDAWVDTRFVDTVVLGASHVSRFGVVAGLVLLAMGWRLQRRHYALIAGAVVAISTVLTAGLGAGTAGAGAAWLAVVVLLMPVTTRWQRERKAPLSLPPPTRLS